MVNLATYDADRASANEEALIRELGMGYHPIPVEWEAPQPGDFASFVKCMDSLRGRKILVHCAANYRVTAFVSLYGMSKLGWPEERADEFVRSVWNPAEYPVWERFITEIKDGIGADD